MSERTCAECGAELGPAIDRVHRLVVLRARVLTDGTTEYRREVLPERYCSEGCAREAADELRRPNEVPPLVLPEGEAEGTDRTVCRVEGRPPFVVWEFREFFPLWLLDEPPWPWEPDYWGAPGEEEDDDEG